MKLQWYVRLPAFLYIPNTLLIPARYHWDGEG
jgi:hypothetical protein